MTLEDKIRLAEEALELVQEVADTLNSANVHRHGYSAMCINESKAKDAAKRAAILLEQIAKEH